MAQAMVPNGRTGTGGPADTTAQRGLWGVREGGSWTLAVMPTGITTKAKLGRSSSHDEKNKGIKLAQRCICSGSVEHR